MDRTRGLGKGADALPEQPLGRQDPEAVGEGAQVARCLGRTVEVGVEDVVEPTEIEAVETSG